MALTAAVAIPIAAAAHSPLLAWRDPIYILGGFAGILGLCVLLFQPLLAAGSLPGLLLHLARKVHRWTGIALVVLVLVHVSALWITSPPDVIDALLFRSPTPFAVWGVVAMWAVFAAALLAAMRRRLRLRPRVWRIMHVSFAIVIVVGTVVHAVLIEGAMEAVSKVALCTLVLLVTLGSLARVKLWTRRKPSGPPA
ncbi:MAG: ferric reductase-like transmembrane domain-containing protein [Pseudomonadota bacterium]